MEKTKIIEVSISALKVTSEDKWLRTWIEKNGDSVKKSPHYKWLNGDVKPIYDWMKFRKLRRDYITIPLIQIFKSLLNEGQKEPIKIYKDRRINTGHKRAACLLFMGKKTIKAEIVPDDYKL